MPAAIASITMKGGNVHENEKTNNLHPIYHGIVHGECFPSRVRIKDHTRVQWDVTPITSAKKTTTEKNHES